MAPCTRRNLHLTPSPEPPVVGCWKTPKRRDFYKALDKNGASKSLTAICIDVGISQPTGTRWKKLRENIGSQAVRTTRSTSTKLGRPSKVTKQMCKEAALVEEWDKITLEEIRKRIGSMPERCKALRDTKGRPIKRALW